MRRGFAIHLCSFAHGWYTVNSPSGKQGLTFEDSDQFGPMKVDVRTGDLTEIPQRHWFWKFYTPWRQANRPTKGEGRGTRYGWGFPIFTAVWVED